MKILLTLPCSRVEFGGFTIDPVKVFLGGSVAELLAAVLDGPIREERVNGARVDQVPLNIPDGIGVLFPIKTLSGDLGFRNDRGHLVITVPAMSMGFVVDALAGELSTGKAIGPHVVVNEGRQSAEFAIAVVPGMSKQIPLGGFGALGVSAR